MFERGDRGFGRRRVDTETNHRQHRLEVRRARAQGQPPKFWVRGDLGDVARQILEHVLGQFGDVAEQHRRDGLQIGRTAGWG
ncbi:hypothetical protein ACWDUN_19195 [Mycobacterium sp. NPDC003323]